jgi:hypothetical protein
MANSSLSLTSLDTKQLAEDFKAFMKTQPAYRDYDYEGSNISAIIRLLAYNTFKNSFFLNMTLSEGFLDTAQTRPSLISHAKELNYVPRSMRSARSRVRVTFTGSEPTYLVEKGRTFSTVVRNQQHIFSVPEALLLTSSTGEFSAETDLYEGPFVADSYTVDWSDETQRLVLTNPSVDTRSLTVVVYEDGDVDGTPYTRAATLLDVDENSKVYFLQAAETGQYEVVFGDNVVGRRPADGATVILDYRVTRGEPGNGAKVFTPDFTIGLGVTNLKITTVDVAEGGAAAETEESIRYYAPRHFQTQERAVSAGDYEVLLRTQFPEIAAVSVFGGEEVEPPQFGKVIVALDISNVDGIPDGKRDEYYTFLKRRCGLTIKPVFVEPKYTYLSIVSRVLYNINVTTLTPENIGAMVLNDVMAYADDVLNDFNSTMRFSRVTGVIDDADRSIVGNQTIVQIYKKVAINKGAQVSGISVDFAMPLYDGYPSSGLVFPSGDKRTIVSQPFIQSGSTVFLTDDGDGGLWVAQSQGASTRLVQRVGTVNYSTGRVLIETLVADSFDGATLKLYAVPAELDVTSGRDTILAVESAEVRLSVTAVRE